MPSPQSDLDLLAVFHYVLAALSALFGLLPALYVALGLALATGRLADGRPPGPERLFGWLFVAVGLALILGALAYAALLALAGRSLQVRRRRTFCLVMAAVSCAFVPFGTALGVFTIVALSRPEVQALFAVTAPPRPATPPAGG